jgi:plasmid stability protein
MRLIVWAGVGRLVMAALRPEVGHWGALARWVKTFRFRSGSIMVAACQMPSYTVKNIPDELYDRLKQSAAAHRRSINSEFLVCLQRGLASVRPDPAPLLARLDALRERVLADPLTDDDLRAARDAGRR